MQFNQIIVNDPYYKTPEPVMDIKLELLQLKAGEVLGDLGCGNALSLVKSVKKYGVKGIGYELEDLPYSDALQLMEKEEVSDQIELRREDFLNADYSELDAVFLYLTRNMLGVISLKLEQELKKGARIVTHDFDLPGWSEKQTYRHFNEKGHEVLIYLYEK